MTATPIDPVLTDRVRAASALLESLVADRGLLALVSSRRPAPPPRCRRRRLPPRRQGSTAPGQGYRPGAEARPDTERRRGPGADRNPHTAPADRLHHAERLPSPGLPIRTIAATDSHRPIADSRNCYICKSDYTTVHHFYDKLCPACGELNFAKRTELADLTRPGGAAHRRPRQDRLPGRTQAAPRRRAPHCHHPLSPRFRLALHRGARFCRLGRPAGDLRARPPPHAERGGVLPPAARRPTTGSTSSSTMPARRCAGRPEFYAHMMAVETASQATLPAAGAPAPRRLRGLRGYHMLPGSTRGVSSPPPLARRAGTDPRRRALTGAAAAGRPCRRHRLLPRGHARSGPAAGGPARAQFLAAADG